jgi:hypothetical protein
LLTDDPGGQHFGAEELRGDARNLFLLLRPGALAGERRRGSYVDEVVGFRGLADATDQQGDVDALPAAVGMELVEDQEAEPLCLGHELAIPLLPRVASEGNGRAAFGVAAAEKLFKLPLLAVG